MNEIRSRREFLKFSAAVAVGYPLTRITLRPVLGDETADGKGQPPYKISLAEWSLHNAIFGGKLNHLDFARVAKREFDIDGVEYVNQFFADKAKDQKYLQDMKTRAQENGVQSLLIMIDREGNLGDPDEQKRTQAVENHYKWVEAAKFLGCHSIRVNAGSQGTYEEQMKLAADGLRRLSEFAAPHDIDVIVENHGGLSSNGQWLAAVIEKVDLPNCGTLPDFGNFGDYNRYQGVEELMPYAKAVSAKSYDFDENGNETTIDYPRLMKIVLDAGYHGYVGIEYEGKRLDEFAGIQATRDLLQRIRSEMAG